MANAVTCSCESRIRSSNFVTRVGSPPRWKVNATALEVDEPWLTYVAGAPVAGAAEVVGAAVVGATTVEVVDVVAVVVSGRAAVDCTAPPTGARAAAVVVLVDPPADDWPLHPSRTAMTEAATAAPKTVRRSRRSFIGSCPYAPASSDPVAGTR